MLVENRSSWSAKMRTHLPRSGRPILPMSRRQRPRTGCSDRERVLLHLVSLLADQGSTEEWFGRQQAYLREHQPPTLIVWGRHDGYMPEGAARAYLRDLQDAELHIFDGGHRLLETHLEEVAALVRDFLSRSWGRDDLGHAQ